MEEPPSKVHKTIGLSPEQEEVLKAVKAGKNVFFTGPAGSGKSYLIERCVALLKERYPPDRVHVTATTGKAASNIGGITLHSFAGVGLGNGTAGFFADQMINGKRYSAALWRWRKARCLIIDEVSMLDKRFFEVLEELARLTRDKDIPFGGLQVILCGDFYQLPPVSDTGFCFQSPKWSQTIQRSISLNTVFRQTDHRTVELLNMMRVGEVDPELIELLEAAEVEEFTDIPDQPVQPTKLMPKNAAVDHMNETKFKELVERTGAEKKTFVAKDNIEGENEEALLKRLDDGYIPKSVTLCVGAQVMLLKNKLELDLYNGSLGVVTGFSDAGKPIIKFDNGVEVSITDHCLEITHDKEVLASRTGIPLRLAYAVSIHKSQGMTLDAVDIDFNGVWESGQAYVALSRARSLKRVRVKGFAPELVLGNNVVTDFYKTLA